MTSIIKLYCLSGGQDCSPPCYLLQIDQFKILLDCGWDEKFSQNIVDEISKHFTSLDAILLSHPDPRHLGALPYLIKKHGVPCPIYATSPVTLMGQMFMTDIVLSKLYNQEFDLFSVEDVEKAFVNDKVKHLDFNSTFQLSKGSGITITPLAAGHMIGGTIWKIVKDEEEEIIYAVDYNHKKERHLNGCEQTLKMINKPSLLITDAFNALNQQGKKKDRDQKFCTTILETLRGGGNVLIPCDTAGRILELALMLEHVWSRKETGLSAYSLALVSNVGTKLIEKARSSVVWMTGEIFQETSFRDKPFAFKHLQIRKDLIELSYLPQPVCVLATMPDLEFGFAKDLFSLWVSDPNYSIIFTQRPSPGTLGYKVLELTSQNNDKPEPPSLNVDLYQRVELKGEELDEYLKKEEEKVQQALIESQKALKIHDIDSESGSSDIEDELNDISKSTQLYKASKHDLMMQDANAKATQFFKVARKTYTMYPAPPERKIKVDAYGEEIDPKAYMMFYKLQGSNKLLEVEEDKENKTSNNQIEDVKEKAIPLVKPTKCLTANVPITINARLHSFDFEGRSDGLSIKNLITHMEPRRMILVGGSPESTSYLADKCRAYVNEKIFKPHTGDIVDATTENHIYQVQLKDSLVTSLNFLQTDSGVELAWVDAKTELAEDDELNLGEKLPQLDVVEQDAIPTHNAIFINELKLSDFKQVLLNNNIQAEFCEGILYCGDRIAIKKHLAGRIHLEGILCDEYFKVRDLLYKQYVIM